MRGRFRIAALLLLLSACGQPVEEPADSVDARNYDAFWLWAGVRPQPVLEQAETLYLLGGEVRADGAALHELRPATPQVDDAALWLVIRTETLAWREEHYRALIARAAVWERANPHFIGVQLDFDSDTRGLDRYAEFLRDLRQRLPQNYRLGITGLLDWSAQGDPVDLVALADVVDEAVFQVYQGRETIPGYERWLMRLESLPMPFRIGLVQGGEWQAPPDLADNPNFRGYVIFLVNDSSQR